MPTCSRGSRSHRKPRSEWTGYIFAGVLALVLVIAADRWLPRADRAAPAGQPVTATDAAPTEALAAATTEAPTAIDPNSIAVLPFVNMSADADNEYFSDGISE